MHDLVTVMTLISLMRLSTPSSRSIYLISYNGKPGKVTD